MDRVDHANASAPATKDVQPGVAPTSPAKNTSTLPKDPISWKFDTSETPLCVEVDR